MFGRKTDSKTRGDIKRQWSDWSMSLRTWPALVFSQRHSLVNWRPISSTDIQLSQSRQSARCLILNKARPAGHAGQLIELVKPYIVCADLLSSGRRVHNCHVSLTSDNYRGKGRVAFGQDLRPVHYSCTVWPIHLHVSSVFIHEHWTTIFQSSEGLNLQENNGNVVDKPHW